MPTKHGRFLGELHSHRMRGLSYDMRSALLALLVLSANAQQPEPEPQPDSLDSSADALAAATSTVTIGSDALYWSAMPSSFSSYNVTVGDKLSFRYTGSHNVYKMASKAAYDSCDFDGATELGSTSVGGGTGDTPNLYEAVVTTAGTLYLACQVGSHCNNLQKVTITAAALPPTPPPTPPSPPPPSSPPVSVSTSAAGCAAALGETPSVVAFEGVPLSQPTALSWHPTRPDELWVTDAGSDSLTVLNASSGAAW